MYDIEIKIEEDWRIIEKIVATRLYEHLETYSLLEWYQSAYKKFHGTQTAILKVQNDIVRKIDNKHAAFFVLLDSYAAFDTIDHNILLLRLNATGVRGPALNWISSYLSCRNQSVSIENDLLSPANLLLECLKDLCLASYFLSSMHLLL